jgi:hypothetical protein
MTGTAFPTPWSTDYADLIVFRPKPTMTDDDVDFQSDRLYIRALIEQIVEDTVCDGYRPQPWPLHLTDDLNTLAAQLHQHRRHPDHANTLLNAWRLENT